VMTCGCEASIHTGACLVWYLAEVVECLTSDLLSLHRHPFPSGAAPVNQSTAR